MSNKYYYLVASLPYLKFGEKGGISRDSFVQECEKWLSGEDLDVILGIDIKEPDIREGEALLAREWKEFDLGLRAIIARTRERKEYVSKDIPFEIKDALDQRDPLLTEKAIEKIRWGFIEGEEPKYMFDTNWLILYCIKIQLLERLAQFDHEKGTETFDKVCEVKYEYEKKER